MPNPEKLRGAKYGRTDDSTSLFALQEIVAGGHACRAHGAHVGHFVGGGHLTSGQRARGHGGHSPDGFWHFEQSRITGPCLGMDDFNT